MAKTLKHFALNLTVVLPLGGAWGLRWNHRAPIGPGAAGIAHPMPSECTGGTILPWCTAAANQTALRFGGKGGWELSHAGSQAATVLGSGKAPATPGQPLRIELQQLAGGEIRIAVGGQPHVAARVPEAAVGGGVAIEVMGGGALSVTEMVVRELTTAPQRWLALLPSEAMTNAFEGSQPQGNGWAPRTDATFRFGAGFVHPGGPRAWGYQGKQTMEVPMAKYNFVGVGARLWLPTGPDYGFISVSVDGAPAKNISLYAPTARNSSVVWQYRERDSAEGGKEQEGDDPQMLKHAHAVVIRWRAPPPPPPPPAPPPPLLQRHPPFIQWVDAPHQSAVFGVPEQGTAAAPVLGTNVTSAAECRALCEARENCTMYTAPMEGVPCWCGNCSWCRLCFGRTDLTWKLHPVASSFSARRVTVPPPPPPAPPPPSRTQGQLFPVDVLEYLPAWAAPQLRRRATISNESPLRCGGNDPTTARCDIDRGTTGSVVNAHDGNLVQDELSGAFFVYGISFPDSCTSSLYDNCVEAPGCTDDFKVTAFRSTDLENWELASEDLGLKDFGDQANVIYNRKTGKYVAIYRGPVGQMEALPVAVADGPVGPFTQLPPISTGGDKVVSQAAWHADEQGNAFAMYNTPGPAGTFFPAKQCMIELTSDWLNATGRKSCWVPPDGFGLEGGAVWDRDGVHYWAAGSPCCNCEEGGSARVYTATDPMGTWSFLTNMNPPVQPRPPVPPPDKRSPGSNPAPDGACELAGSWVGSVYLASGGQPLRAGLRVTKLPDGRWNFSETQPHFDRVVGLGTVAVANGIANISIVEGPSKGTVGVADAWPGLPPAGGCTRILWSGGAVTWGKLPAVHETKFGVSSQMFGVAKITGGDGEEPTWVYSGERYQTAPDGLFGHGMMYWQPLRYDAAGVPAALSWVGNFTLPLPAG